MDSDNKAWCICTTVVSAAIFAIVVSTQSFYKHEAETIKAMVATGADPIAAKCSLSDDYGKHPTCIIAATKLLEK